MSSIYEVENDEPYKLTIYFDINDNALRSNYPYKNKEHGSSNYKNAYRDIARILKDEGFVRQQGSGYISENYRTQLSIYTVIENWAEKMPWLSRCFERLDLTIAGETHDLTNFFKVQVKQTQNNLKDPKGISQTSNYVQDITFLKRKQYVINFDISQNLLKKYYPYNSKIHSPTAYKKAYGLIANYFESVDFTHRQYSGYYSNNEISIAEAENVVGELARKYPWLKECVKNIELTIVPNLYDMTGIFKKHALLQLENEKQNLQNKKQIGIHHKKDINTNIRQ